MKNVTELAEHDITIKNKIEKRVNNIENILKRKDLSNEYIENLNGQLVAYKRCLKIIDDAFVWEVCGEEGL